MAVNPQAQVVLDTMAAAGFQLGGDPVELRAMMALAPRPEGEPVAKVEDRTIPANGADIPVRIYRPEGTGTKPVLVWYHGGGWVIGSLDGSDYGCRIMANASGAVVISVDYRLAPESKFPTAADDCYEVTKWVSEHAAELGVDASRLAVGGDSAGGNLAAVVAHMARDAGGPAIAYQALIYPVTNHSYDTGSYSANADGYLLTKDSMVWFWNHYLNDESDGQHPKASPLRLSDHSSLPPAYVITAEFDPLRDEGEAYAKRLRESGVEVEAKRFDGQIHGFFANPAIEEGQEAARMIGKKLADILK
ncbi:MAG: alpha/beta hydrolase [bacterium]